MARVSFSVEAAGALSFFFEAHGRLPTVPLLFGRVVIVSTAKDRLSEMVPFNRWWPQGAVVITNAGRPDVILAMQALQRSAELANCAAVVLTGGGE